LIVAWLIASGIPAGPPATVASRWRSVAIQGGGFVTGVITHPTAKDLRYSRTDIGGAYRWDPKVNRWVPLQDWLATADLNLTGVESLAIDPTDPQRVYIAAVTCSNSWAGNGAFLRSRDQGRTWQRTDVPFQMGGNMPGRSMGERLVMNPRQARQLYFGSRSNGLWHSMDHGATWNPVRSFPAPNPPNGLGVTWITFSPRETGTRASRSPPAPAFTGARTAGSPGAHYLANRPD